MRALLPADWQVDYVTALGDDMYSGQMTRLPRKGEYRHRPHPDHRRQAPGPLHDPPGKGRPALHLLARPVRRQAPGRRLSGAAKPRSMAPSMVYFSGISMAILAPRARGELMKAIVGARKQGRARGVRHQPPPCPLDLARNHGIDADGRRDHRRRGNADAYGRSPALRRQGP